MLLGGVPGVPAAKVVVLGGGVVGTNAARMAIGLEAHVTILDVSLPRLAELDMQFGAMLNTIYSTIDSIEEHVLGADLVIGAVLVPGAAAPKLITEAMVKQMKKGSVLVDVAIDQGGCSETSHAHDARRSDLHGARRGALLRRQHAGRAWRAPRPSRSTTRRCPSPSRWPSTGRTRRWRRTRICAPGSTSTRAR